MTSEISVLRIAENETIWFSDFAVPVDEEYPLSSKRCKMSEVSLQTIHNGRLVSAPRSIGVFDEFGEPLVDALIGDQQSLSRVYNDVPDVSIDGTVVVMTSLSPQCFYHWLVDTLPGFEILNHAGVDISEVDYFFMKQCTSNFQLDLLKKMGIGRGKIICSNSDIDDMANQHNVNAKIDKILIPRFRDLKGGWPNKWVVQKMQKRFGTVVAPWMFNSVSDTKNRLYIKRGKGAREILNETKLIVLLQNRGFKIIEMSGRPIEKQCEAVQSADLILGAHGSALGNAIFACAGTYLIEFYGEYVTSHFRVVSQIAGLNYGVFKAGVVEGYSMDSTSISELRAMPFSVDLDKLQQYLTDIGV